MPESPGRNDTLRVATYNVHGWVGTDKARDPERTLSVISGLEADLVALQEVVFPFTREPGQSMKTLEDATGLHAVPGRTMLKGRASYGNVLLCRQPPEEVVRHDISRIGREPRGIIEAWFTIKGCRVQALATHFGLAGRERRRQAFELVKHSKRGRADLRLVLGDLNEWRPLSRVSRVLAGRFGQARGCASYPTRWPVLHLDRIYARPSGLVLSQTAIRTPATRLASDHYPVMVTIALSGAGTHV